MSDGLSDYWATRLRDGNQTSSNRERLPYWRNSADDVAWFQTDDGGWIPNRGLTREESRLYPPPIDAPIVPRITEYGRLMYADDLGLPEPSDAPFCFWLGKEG